MHIDKSSKKKIHESVIILNLWRRERAAVLTHQEIID